MHRHIGRYRRSKHIRTMTSLTLVINTPLRQHALILLQALSPSLICNLHHFRTNNSPVADTQQMTCVRLPVIYVLKSDNGR